MSQDGRTDNIAQPAAGWVPPWLRQLTPAGVRSDLLAGFTGAVMVLPQGVAYALIAGMPAEYGLYSAMVVAAVAAFFGSSHHLVTGPAAALSIMLFSVLSPLAQPGTERFIELAILLTLMVGVIQLTLGVIKAGNLVAYISHTVVVGFTSGAAILIATSQIGHALGVVGTSGSLFDQWYQLFQSLPDSHAPSLLIAVVTLLVTVISKRLSRRIPALLVGMMAGSLLCWWLDGPARGVAMVGEIRSSWPIPRWPAWSAEELSLLVPGAVTVAILGLVEAAAIARSVAIRSGQRIDANREFIGQGIGNTFGSFFSCFAGSGSFTRSALNYESGARTPLSVISSSVFLLMILLLVPDITAWLPLPAMAGGILLIAWNLFDVQQIRHLKDSHRSEWIVFAVTFVATLTIRLEFAVLLGVVVSLWLYLDKTSRPDVIEIAPLQPAAPEPELRNAERLQLPLCPALLVLRVDGAVFFGSADHIQQAIQRHCANRAGIRHVLLNLTGVHHIDLAGADVLLQEQQRLAGEGVTLSVCRLKALVQQQPDAAWLVERLGADRVFASTEHALDVLVDDIERQGDRCTRCTARIFAQCSGARMD